MLHTTQGWRHVQIGCLDERSSGRRHRNRGRYHKDGSGDAAALPSECSTRPAAVVRVSSGVSFVDDVRGTRGRGRFRPDSVADEAGAVVPNVVLKAAVVEVGVVLVGQAVGVGGLGLAARLHRLGWMGADGPEKVMWGKTGKRTEEKGEG